MPHQIDAGIVRSV